MHWYKTHQFSSFHQARYHDKIPDEAKIEASLRVTAALRTIIYESPVQVLFRFALAFLKLHEEPLLAAPDYMTACAILRGLGTFVCPWHACFGIRPGDRG